jgi:hypothetical protein
MAQGDAWCGESGTWQGIVEDYTSAVEKGGNVREPFEVIFIIGQKMGDAMYAHRRDQPRIVSILS